MPVDAVFVDAFVSADRRKVLSKLVVYCDNCMFRGDGTICSTAGGVGGMFIIASCDVVVLLFDGITNASDTLLPMRNNVNIKLIFIVLCLSND